MVDVSNGARCRCAMLSLPEANPKEAFQPCYGYRMTTHALSQIERSQINGAAVRRPPRPPVADECLYRYVPVPPVCRDENGFLVEDGMGQVDKHLHQTTLWYHVLKEHLPAATVCGDMFLYYDESDDNKVLVPDLLVSLRAPRRAAREHYRLWEDPVPDLVIEMLSKTTYKKDTGSKRATYEHLGVREYWLHNPEGFGSSAPLVGLRLQDDRFEEIVADAAGRRRSEVLGLDLLVHEGELRFRNPATGQLLCTYEEAERGRLAERNRADEAEDRADTAERGRVAERNRADAEKTRADAAERELARLRRRLGSP